MPAIKRNHTVDIYRLLASLMIVFLHVGYNNLDEKIVAYIRLSCRWCVPFFFILSGYYFHKSMIKNPDKTIWNSCSKIVQIMILANIVYIIAQYIIGIELSFKQLFPGSYFHLWFLPSLIIGIVSSYLFEKLKVAFDVRLFISLLIIFVILLADSYSFFINLEKLNLGGKVIPLLSIPFMTIGAFFSVKNGPQGRKSTLNGIILIIAGLISQVVEANLIYNYTGRNMNDHQYLVGTSLIAIGVTIIAFSTSINNEKLGKMGKDYSLFIYLYHPLIILLFYQIDVNAIFKNYTIIFFPFVVYTITLILGIILNKYINPIFLLLTGSFNYKVSNIKNTQ